MSTPRTNAPTSSPTAPGTTTPGTAAPGTQPAPRNGRPADDEGRTLSVEENRASRRRSLRLLGELIAPVKGQFVLMGLMVVVAQLAVVAGPAIIAWGIDEALPALIAGDGRPALLAAALHITAAVVGGLLTFGYVRQSVVVGQRMLLTLRRRVFQAMQQQDLEFHERYTSGRIVSRQTSDMETLRELLDSGVNVMVGASLSMVFTIVLIVGMDVPTGLVMLGMLVPCVLLTIWFQRRSREAYRANRTHSARLIVHFVEALGGIRAVKAFRRERDNDAEFDRLAGQYRDSSMAAIRVFGVYQPALRVLANATIALVLLVGGFRVVAGDLQVGVLVALVLYARRFFQPVDEIANFYNTFQSAVAALEKIATLLAEQPRVVEPERPTPLPRARGEIAFHDASFRYRPDTPIVLQPLDLHIPAGQTVALVGRTGAGKSTIAKLVARFYDVSDGRVTLDGVDLRELSTQDLTRAVVMVTQEAYLFSGTVADNIALGRPGASREEIEAAADAIGAGEFIRALPDGFDTDVHRRGVRVSAGQRQLISFARAFLADPRVLILDEATSSLDIPSERAVQEGLTSLLGQRTALIIAHRLSTVMIADRVLVVDDGRVVEDGSPQELVAAGGRFAALYQAWQDSL
ncbi:ABC transporter ATP-binding protein [Brachybacterium sp. EF45031]|uniref:ABC transporter ATP-binding protein n=1 Tax=Brachybacterium sillae TaxID=2810536 RepID=UPI00217F202D|nr:ABC transporter ATP-binding protein [Brachybacterium sillae]MCS6711953.1 ABC transporter ATP-binding protein [Brachybacterium sillae]